MYIRTRNAICFLPVASGDVTAKLTRIFSIVPWQVLGNADVAEAMNLNNSVGAQGWGNLQKVAHRNSECSHY